MALNKMEDRPWLEWKNGKPMTPNSLARFLGRYNIKPKQMKLHGCNVRGYEKAGIEKACRLYAANKPDPSRYTATSHEITNDINELEIAPEVAGSTSECYPEKEESEWKGEDFLNDSDDDDVPF